MKFLEFFNSLKPSFSKKTLTENLQSISEELNSYTIPIYENAKTDFHLFKFKSKEVNSLTKRFDLLVKRKKGDMISTIYFALVNISDITNKLIRVIDKDFEANVTNYGLTFSKAQKIQLVEAIDYTTRYSRKLLNYILEAETVNLDDGNALNKRLTPQQIQNVISFFPNYCRLINGFMISPAEILTLFAKIPNILITPESIETQTAMNGKVALDPLSFNLIAAWLNPIYHIGLKLAEYQSRRFEEAKEERDMLNLKLLNLKNLNTGTPDPVIEKEIAYYNNLIQELELNIEDMERKYGE